MWYCLFPLPSHGTLIWSMCEKTNMYEFCLINDGNKRTFTTRDIIPRTNKALLALTSFFLPIQTVHLTRLVFCETKQMVSAHLWSVTPWFIWYSNRTRLNCRDAILSMSNVVWIFFYTEYISSEQLQFIVLALTTCYTYMQCVLLRLTRYMINYARTSV